MNIADRMEARSIPEPNSGCRLWMGTVDGAGYGVITHRHKRIGAHRMAWTIAHGPIADGLCVCHKCDVPLCVNPDHLFLGTKAANSADMAAKGRAKSGSAPGLRRRNTKLTDEIVRGIRAATGKCREIAEQFGCAPSTVSMVRQRKRWEHVA